MPFGRSTHLPLPRFAALHAGVANLRVGPGTRYPIDWVLRRRLLPVEIIEEFKDWRQIRLFDGTEGWVHMSLLTGRRRFIIKDRGTHSLRASGAPSAPVTALLRGHVIGSILSCDKGSDWCRVQAGGHRGYLPRSVFWGTRAGEAVSR